MHNTGAPPHLRTANPPPPSVAELATRAAKLGAAGAMAVAGGTAGAARGRLLRVVARRRLEGAPQPLRLCLGSGHAPIDGWTNIDFEPPADVLVDLRFGLPVPDGSVSAIYSEHLVEHLSVEVGIRLFREWRRALRADGVVRIATPDLARLVASLGADDWRSGHAWLTWPEHAFIDSPVRMLNVAIRAWGHLYLYDFDELTLRLRQAGFRDVRRVSIGESEEPALRGLETRADSTLVVEARP